MRSQKAHRLSSRLYSEEFEFHSEIFQYFNIFFVSGRRTFKVCWPNVFSVFHSNRGQAMFVDFFSCDITYGYFGCSFHPRKFQTMCPQLLIDVLLSLFRCVFSVVCNKIVVLVSVIRVLMLCVSFSGVGCLSRMFCALSKSTFTGQYSSVFYCYILSFVDVRQKFVESFESFQVLASQFVIVII